MFYLSPSFNKIPKGCYLLGCHYSSLYSLDFHCTSGSKARALAVAWARKDKYLAARQLANSKEFGLVEVLKAATLLDSGRKMREWEKKLKLLRMQTKVAPQKIAKITTNIHNLSNIKPSVSCAPMITVLLFKH